MNLLNTQIQQETNHIQNTITSLTQTYQQQQQQQQNDLYTQYTALCLSYHQYQSLIDILQREKERVEKASAASLLQRDIFETILIDCINQVKLQVRKEREVQLQQEEQQHQRINTESKEAVNDDNNDNKTLKITAVPIPNIADLTVDQQWQILYLLFAQLNAAELERDNRNRTQRGEIAHEVLNTAPSVAAEEIQPTVSSTSLSAVPVTASVDFGPSFFLTQQDADELTLNWPVS